MWSYWSATLSSRDSFNLQNVHPEKNVLLTKHSEGVLPARPLGDCRYDNIWWWQRRLSRSQRSKAATGWKLRLLGDARPGLTNTVCKSLPPTATFKGGLRMKSHCTQNVLSIERSLQRHCQCKNKDRPREVQTSVFKQRRRVCGDSEEGQERLERLYLEGHCVLRRAKDASIRAAQHRQHTLQSSSFSRKGVEKPKEAHSDFSF